MLLENIENMLIDRERVAEKKGLEQGRAGMFKDLLLARFGKVPDSIAAKVDAATPEQLREWGARLFVVSNIEAVFAS